MSKKNKKHNAPETVVAEVPTALDANATENPAAAAETPTEPEVPQPAFVIPKELQELYDQATPEQKALLEAQYKVKKRGRKAGTPSEKKEAGPRTAPENCEVGFKWTIPGFESKLEVEAKKPNPESKAVYNTVTFEGEVKVKDVSAQEAFRCIQGLTGVSKSSIDSCYKKANFTRHEGQRAIEAAKKAAEKADVVLKAEATKAEVPAEKVEA